MEMVYVINKILSILTIVGQIFIAYAFITNIITKLKISKINNIFSRYIIHLVFVISLTATSGSLFFSEIAGFEPCKLCWYQRIFMYPQVFIYLLALYKNDKKVLIYGLLLSIIGGAISTYHYLSQLGVVNFGNCAVIGYSVSCSKLFIMDFGYITIPMMASTAFIMIITVILLYNKN